MATDIPASIRKQVLTRDQSRCRWCGRTNGGLHLHHIKYRSAGVDHSPENLITLCPRHHELVHSNKRLYPSLLWKLMANPTITGLQLVRQEQERDSCVPPSRLASRLNREKQQASGT